MANHAGNTSASAELPSSRGTDTDDDRPPARSRLRETALLVGLMSGGVVWGIAVKAVDGAGAPLWVRDLGNYPALFLLALAVVAALSPTVLAAAVRTLLLFLGLCAGYYAWSLFGFGFLGTASLAAWTAVVLTFVPASAAAVRWAAARPGGPLPGLVFAGIAAAALVDGTLRPMWWALSGHLRREDWFLLHPAQAVFDVAVALLIACLLPRHGRTRAWALVLLLPMTFVAERMVALAYAYGGLG